MSHTDPSRHASGPHGGPLDNVAVDHEHSDVDIRPLISFGIGLAVVTAVVCVLMYALFWFFNSQAAKNDPPVSPLARPPAQMPASTAGNPYFGQAEGPRLLTNEPTVLTKQRMTEAETLGSYGWVDEKTGIARMPINEAKKLILQRGLPARTEAAPPALGTHRAAYGDTSSGRAITGQVNEPATKDEGTKQEAAPAPAPKGHGQ